MNFDTNTLLKVGLAAAVLVVLYFVFVKKDGFEEEYQGVPAAADEDAEIDYSDEDGEEAYDEDAEVDLDEDEEDDEDDEDDEEDLDEDDEDEEEDEEEEDEQEDEEDEDEELSLSDMPQTRNDTAVFTPPGY
jgi:hypothetical protein